MLTLLRDEEWGKRSQRWIAEKCGVHHQTVANISEELSKLDSWKTPSTTTGRDGQERPATRPARQPSAAAVLDEDDSPAEDSIEDEAPEPTELQTADPRPASVCKIISRWHKFCATIRELPFRQKRPFYNWQCC